ncbi:MAG TPA: PLP-dependent aspartate aminotransferase family protein [Oligoflexia bacterium]|nr:PLP-dependent aspartate aminotransferase family protein [Oligoflexia bacterium]HMR25667.1 PLP-dependent aspartate aminotransferase family protein [Oligoflexia bacterium]
MKHKGFNTISIHAGEDKKIEGAVVQPIFQSATYLEQEGLAYNDIKYLRLNNSPNHECLGRKLASLEQTEAALLCASGMAAVTTAIMSQCKTGDHIIAQKGLYGGTHHFLVHKAAQLGIELSFIDIDQPSSWQSAVKQNTRLFYCESITNPLMHVGDLAAVPDFCRQHELLSMIDNTFATPYNFKPSQLGFDIIIHSATKYLNGHSDLVAGVICANTALIKQCKSYLDIYGATLDTHACFLLQRGLKTLGLRMSVHNSNAMQLAQFLQEQASIETVYYPGLKDAAVLQHFKGYSGMVSFAVKGGKEAAQNLINHLKIPQHAPSLGGVESLITRPAASSHSSMSEEERQSLGISQALLRLSVGIEDIEDLQEDLHQALKKL